jgi:hypothetical protein
MHFLAYKREPVATTERNASPKKLIRSSGTFREPPHSRKIVGKETPKKNVTARSSVTSRSRRTSIVRSLASMLQPRIEIWPRLKEEMRSNLSHSSALLCVFITALALSNYIVKYVNVIYVFLKA